jgi:hypothetical protein
LDYYQKLREEAVRLYEESEAISPDGGPETPAAEVEPEPEPALAAGEGAPPA